jgi:hypothetical protein
MKDFMEFFSFTTIIRDDIFSMIISNQLLQIQLVDEYKNSNAPARVSNFLFF